jgi:hypothetical protein
MKNAEGNEARYNATEVGRHPKEREAEREFILCIEVCVPQKDVSWRFMPTVLKLGLTRKIQDQIRNKPID